MKLPNINPKLFVAGLALCVAGGALIAWVSGMPFWGGATIVAFALVFNGVIAEVEDNAADGVKNPKGNLK